MGGVQNPCLMSFQAILRCLVSLCTGLFHAQGWLELGGSLLSLGHMRPSSLPSSPAPFTPSHLPEWPNQEFTYSTSSWEPSGFCEKEGAAVSEITDLLTDVSGNLFCLIYFSAEKNQVRKAATLLWQMATFCLLRLGESLGPFFFKNTKELSASCPGTDFQSFVHVWWLEPGDQYKTSLRNCFT